MDPPTEELIDSLPGPSLNYSILAQMMSSQDVFPTLTTQPRQHSNFSPIAFVDGLERVDISTIAEEDMRCPHCWLPFAQDVAYLTAFRELPFFEGVDDNDPVRTPCGHIFGKRCLLMSLEKTSRSCPLCRAEFISDPGSPVLTVSFPTFDELNTPGQ
ncbi:hypothetical protein GQ44DRAFT_708851 [Phaeosphaeriaceae sp. PMI808]|nr:hypothetical protein GQ44DRAFT_708851 [Phaeosphaeriaceae sp. PMI808]